jgi:hypothetical protein
MAGVFWIQHTAIMRAMKARIFGPQVYPISACHSIPRLGGRTDASCHRETDPYFLVQRTMALRIVVDSGIARQRGG